MSRSGALHVISAIEAAAGGGAPGRPARHAAAHRASTAGRSHDSVLSRVRRMLAAAPAATAEPAGTVPVPSRPHGGTAAQPD